MKWNNIIFHTNRTIEIISTLFRIFDNNKKKTRTKEFSRIESNFLRKFPLLTLMEALECRNSSVFFFPSSNNKWTSKMRIKQFEKKQKQPTPRCDGSICATVHFETKMKTQPVHRHHCHHSKIHNKIFLFAWFENVEQDQVSLCNKISLLNYFS